MSSGPTPSPAQQAACNSWEIGLFPKTDRMFPASASITHHSPQPLPTHPPTNGGSQDTRLIVTSRVLLRGVSMTCLRHPDILVIEGVFVRDTKLRLTNENPSGCLCRALWVTLPFQSSANSFYSSGWAKHRTCPAQQRAAVLGGGGMWPHLLPAPWQHKSQKQELPVRDHWKPLTWT